MLTHSRVVYPVIGQVEMVIVCSHEVAGVQKLGYETSPTHIQQAGQHGASTLALWMGGGREGRERERGGGEKIRWREVKGRKCRLKREEGGEEKDREGERREERNKRWGGRG